MALSEAELPLLVYAAIRWVPLISMHFKSFGLSKPGIDSSISCLMSETKASEHNKISVCLKAPIRSPNFPYNPQIFDQKTRHCRFLAFTDIGSNLASLDKIKREKNKKIKT